jgi:alpha-D-ribose 1-methylphosphonate 5-triphosphate synthase subunit PhnG
MPQITNLRASLPSSSCDVDIDRFRTGELSLETCGWQVRIGRGVVGDLWVTGWDRESCPWRPVGDRFRSGALSLQTCGWQFSSDRESCPWRPVGDRFRSGELSLETCGWQVEIGRVVVGDLWVTGWDRESCR